MRKKLTVKIVLLLILLGAVWFAYLIDNDTPSEDKSYDEMTDAVLLEHYDVIEARDSYQQRMENSGQDIKQCLQENMNQQPLLRNLSKFSDEALTHYILHNPEEKWTEPIIQLLKSRVTEMDSTAHNHFVKQFRMQLLQLPIPEPENTPLDNSKYNAHLQWAAIQVTSIFSEKDTLDMLTACYLERRVNRGIHSFLEIMNHVDNPSVESEKVLVGILKNINEYHPIICGTDDPRLAIENQLRRVRRNITPES